MTFVWVAAQGLLDGDAMDVDGSYAEYFRT